MPFFVRKLLFALCAGVALLATTPASAQSFAARFEAAVAREFRGYAESDARLDEAIRHMYPERLSPAKHLLVRKELRKLMQHPQLARVVSQALAALVPTDPDAATVHLALVQTVSGLQGKGLLRLSDEDLVLFYRHTVAVLKSLPVATCRDAALERLSDLEMRELEVAFLARTADDYFRDVTELYFRATLAELDQFPHPRTVSREQVQLAQRVYESRLQSVLKRFPNVLPTGNMPATAKQECQYMMLVLQTLVDMPDPYRSWQLTFITTYAAQ